MNRTQNDKAYAEALEHHLLEARGAAEELLEAVAVYIDRVEQGPVNGGHVGSLEEATKLMERALEMLGRPRHDRR
jgi:hypothetical protein